MINSINTNIAAYYAQQNINIASTNTSLSVARLSSGNRIVRASDDVAALSAGTSLRTQVTTLRTALLNAAQGGSLLQVADGALSQIIDILQRQKSIAVQAGSGSLGDTERSFLNQEFQALTLEINRISSSTNFNNVQLINGGLGTTTILAIDATAAANYDPTAVTGSTAPTAVASTSPIQAFTSLGADKSIAGGTGAGDIDITDSTGTLLTTGYDGVNGSLHGQFESFALTDVLYGAGTGSATLEATINGVTFTGNVADAATTALLSNGNTYITINFTAIDLTDAGSTALSEAQMVVDFDDTFLQRTVAISGVDFSGTRLAGVIGSAAYGVASGRLNDVNASISNFRYGGNTGAADTNILTVEVNGVTFTASGILDAFASATPELGFQSDDGQTLVVDLTPSGTVVWGDFTNIRTNLDEQTALINSLNIAFSRAGGGLNFAVGAATTDTITVQLSSANTAILFNGESLDVASSASAAAAAVTVGLAIQTATSLRADVGALQSRFNFASANLESSIQNQDAARGVLLDTDIAAESTIYATNQVKLQAGISVLAQANLQLQSLLKLLG